MPARFDPLSHPILFRAPLALSGLSAWVEHIPFGGLLIQLLSPATLVELGTHCGDSYLSFCQAASELKLPTRCWAVDTWTGDKHSGPYGPDVLRWLRSNHDAPYSAFSTLLQKEFDSAVHDFADGQIDLLHIDGLHTYEAVKHDFDTWLPKLSRRAVVMLHDTQVKVADFGVWRVWEEVSKGKPCFEFEHGYGLGVLAVGPDVPAEVLDFLEFAAANADIVRRLFAGLGERTEAMRRLSSLATLLLKQGSYIRALAVAAGSPWTLPISFDAVFAQIVPYTDVLTGMVANLARENLQLREALQPSGRPPQTPPQTP